MALRVIALLITLILSCSAALAQDSVKRSIFESCDQAKEDFSKLTVEQQSSLLDFLARVIALNTQSPSAPEVYAVAPGTQIAADTKGLSAPRGTDLIPGALWQSMDAKRELRAKRCALDLLEEAGDLALSVLPALVATYSEQPLSDEIAVGVEEVVASIAETAHKTGRNLEPQQLSSLVPHVLGQRPLVARNVIHEFRQEALPHLIALIATRSEKINPELATYLAMIDPDGSESFRASMALVSGLTADQVRHITSELALPSPSALPGFIGEFIRLSTLPTHSPTFIELLGRSCVTLSGITVDQTQQESIAKIPQILSAGAMAPEQAACLVQSSQPLAKRVVEQLSGVDGEQRSYLIELSLRGLQGSPADTRNEAYAALRRIALDPGSAARTEALRALSAFPERKVDTISLAQQLFRIPSKTDRNTSDVQLEHIIFDLLNSLSVTKDTTKFAGTVMRSIQSADPAPGAIEMAKLAQLLDPKLLSLALTTPPTRSSLVALEILASRKDIPLKALASLIELLKYPDALHASLRTLLAIGKPSIAPVRKALPRLSQPTARIAALGLLAELNSTTKAEAQALASALSALNDCSFIGQRVQLLCSLNKNAQGDPDINQVVTSLYQRCVADFNHQSLHDLTKCGPEIIFQSAESVGTMLQSGASASSRVIPVVDLALRTMTSDPKVSGALVAQILLNGPSELQTRILKELAFPHTPAPELQNALQILVERTAGDSEPPAPLVRALAYTGDTRYPWREFVKKAISGAAKGNLDRETAEVISIIPVDPVLAEVLPALESDNSDQLVGASLVGGALGTKAIPLVSRLWHLRTMRPPAIRYTAALALLEINPLTPDMHDTLRRILVNRFFDTAVTMPIPWTNTVAVNDLKRGSFGTLRQDRLEKLLSLK
jgi:hypothetical protein